MKHAGSGHVDGKGALQTSSVACALAREVGNDGNCCSKQTTGRCGRQIDSILFLETSNIPRGLLAKRTMVYGLPAEMLAPD